MKRSANKSGTGSHAEGVSGPPSANKPKFPKTLWKQEEDAVLWGAVTQYKERHSCRTDKDIRWPVIAAQVAAAGIQNRNDKSCRLRWASKLSGNILDLKLHPFTPQEDNFILQASAVWTRRDELGNVLPTPWTLVARCLPGRSDGQLKNRWNSHLSKRAGWVPIGSPRGGWTDEEVQREAGIRKFEAMLAHTESKAVEYKVVDVPASSPATPPTPPQEPVQPKRLVPPVHGMVFPEMGDDLLPLGDGLEDLLAGCGFLASEGEAPALAEYATAVPQLPQLSSVDELKLAFDQFDQLR